MSNCSSSVSNTQKVIGSLVSGGIPVLTTTGFQQKTGILTLVSDLHLEGEFDGIAVGHLVPHWAHRWCPEAWATPDSLPPADVAFEQRMLLRRPPLIINKVIRKVINSVQVSLLTNWKKA